MNNSYEQVFDALKDKKNQAILQEARERFAKYAPFVGCGPAVGPDPLPEDVEWFKTKILADDITGLIATSIWVLCGQNTRLLFALHPFVSKRIVDIATGDKVGNAYATLAFEYSKWVHGEYRTGHIRILTKDELATVTNFFMENKEVCEFWWSK